MNAVLEQTPRPRQRIGVVSFLNSKPLIEGLGQAGDVDLVYEVPAKLPAMLESGSVDVALVPVIDLVRPGRTWSIVSDACIGCDGETLTVRVFSKIVPEAVQRLHVDGDSHTSVALATILWRELYGTDLSVIPLTTGTEPPEDREAILLIGDKVVTSAPRGYDIQTDLGSAWKSLTSLPFVFAVWAASTESGLSGFSDRLSAARDAGVRVAEELAADFGPALGWPIALARRYLTAHLKFTLGPRQRRGMGLFLELAKRHGLVPADQELVFA
jgi:chorismate dehydratase